MKRALPVDGGSNRTALDLATDLIARQISAPPKLESVPPIRVGDMQMRRKAKNSTPDDNEENPMSEEIKSSQDDEDPDDDVVSMQNQTQLRINMGLRVMDAIDVQHAPKPSPSVKPAKKKKPANTDASDAGAEKDPKAAYYKYEAPLYPCARDYIRRYDEDEDGDGTNGDDAENDGDSSAAGTGRISRTTERKKCFICNWSMYSGSGFTADKIGEFFSLYDEAKKMPNFHSVCGILAEFYMEEVYREDLGMFPMTEVSIFNCIRGNHGTDHEDYLRNTIDMLKSKQNELMEKNYLGNYSVHTENDRALERTIKLISLLHRELAAIRKDSDGTAQQSTSISLSRVVSKSTQSANRRSRTSQTAEHSSRNLSPLPF